jgi:hypothetical protein
MALTGTTDITLNENFKNLPAELKAFIFPYIDIRKFVSYDDTEVEPFVDAYIKNYINTRLFTNASMFTFLRHTNLYGQIIEDKVYKMAIVWAKDFMDQCQLLNEKPEAERSLWSVCFNIKYARRYVDKRTGHINTTPMKTSIQYNPHNGLFFFRHSSIIQEPMMNTSIIINEMTSSLIHFMNMLFSGVYQIHSIELVKKNSSSTFGPSTEEQIVKKYY